MKFVSQVQGGGKIVRGNVFLIAVIPYPPLPIKGWVSKVHVRVGRLVLVVAPAIEDVFAETVQVDEEADIGISIKDPLGVLLSGSEKALGP